MDISSFCLSWIAIQWIFLDMVFAEYMPMYTHYWVCTSQWNSWVIGDAYVRLRYIAPNHFPKWIFLQQCRRVLITPFSHQHWVISILLILIILLGMVQDCTVILIYIFQMSQEVECFLFMFIDHFDIFSDEVSKSFVHFSTGLSLFFSLIFRSCLYISNVICFEEM